MFLMLKSFENPLDEIKDIYLSILTNPNPLNHPLNSLLTCLLMRLCIFEVFWEFLTQVYHDIADTFYR